MSTVNHRRRHCRLALTAAAVVAAQLLAPALAGRRGTAAAQFPPPDTSRPLAATLLKRLGEAVDGYRTGAPVFVVASYEFPHAALGVFASRETAADSARRGGSNFAVFGPFLSLPDLSPPRGIPGPIRPPEFVPGGGCPHASSSAYTTRICPDLPMNLLPLEDVVDITVTVRTRDGRSISSTYGARDADAVFFTMSAMDKFVFPYYAQLFGVEYAAGMRRELLERWSQR